MNKQSYHTGNEELVANLTELLNGGNSHAGLDKALEDITLQVAGSVPEGLPYSIWQLAEHIRIAQRDILDFSRDSQHVSPKWPDEYWPQQRQPADAGAWQKCIEKIKTDRQKFIELLTNAGADLYKPFPHGTGQNLLREALVLADHNSYHAGEIVVIRRLLGAWK